MYSNIQKTFLKLEVNSNTGQLNKNSLPLNKEKRNEISRKIEAPSARTLRKVANRKISPQDIEKNFNLNNLPWGSIREASTMTPLPWFFLASTSLNRKQPTQAKKTENDVAAQNNGTFPMALPTPFSGGELNKIVLSRPCTKPHASVIWEKQNEEITDLFSSAATFSKTFNNYDNFLHLNGLGDRIKCPKANNAFTFEEFFAPHKLPQKPPVPIVIPENFRCSLLFCESKLWQENNRQTGRSNEARVFYYRNPLGHSFPSRREAIADYYKLSTFLQPLNDLLREQPISVTERFFMPMNDFFFSDWKTFEAMFPRERGDSQSAFFELYRAFSEKALRIFDRPIGRNFLKKNFLPRSTLTFGENLADAYRNIAIDRRSHFYFLFEQIDDEFDELKQFGARHQINVPQSMEDFFLIKNLAQFPTTASESQAYVTFPAKHTRFQDFINLLYLLKNRAYYYDEKEDCWRLDKPLLNEICVAPGSTPPIEPKHHVFDFLQTDDTDCAIAKRFRRSSSSSGLRTDHNVNKHDWFNKISRSDCDLDKLGDFCNAFFSLLEEAPNVLMAPACQDWQRTTATDHLEEIFRHFDNFLLRINRPIAIENTMARLVYFLRNIMLRNAAQFQPNCTHYEPLETLSSDSYGAGCHFFRHREDFTGNNYRLEEIKFTPERRVNLVVEAYQNQKELEVFKSKVTPLLKKENSNNGKKCDSNVIPISGPLPPMHERTKDRILDNYVRCKSAAEHVAHFAAYWPIINGFSEDIEISREQAESMSIFDQSLFSHGWFCLRYGEQFKKENLNNLIYLLLNSSVLGTPVSILVSQLDPFPISFFNFCAFLGLIPPDQETVLTFLESFKQLDLEEPIANGADGVTDCDFSWEEWLLSKKSYPFSQLTTAFFQTIREKKHLDLIQKSIFFSHLNRLIRASSEEKLCQLYIPNYLTIAGYITTEKRREF